MSSLLQQIDQLRYQRLYDENFKTVFDKWAQSQSDELHVLCVQLEFEFFSTPNVLEDDQVYQKAYQKLLYGIRDATQKAPKDSPYLMDLYCLQATAISLSQNTLNLDQDLMEIFTNMPEIQIKALIQYCGDQPFRVRTILEMYLMDVLLQKDNIRGKIQQLSHIEDVYQTALNLQGLKQVYKQYNHLKQIDEKLQSIIKLNLIKCTSQLTIPTYLRSQSNSKGKYLALVDNTLDKQKTAIINLLNLYIDLQNSSQAFKGQKTEILIYYLYKLNQQIVPLLKMSSLDQKLNFKDLIKQIKFQEYTDTFGIPKIEDQLENWNDFVFMNFLAIEAKLDQIQKDNSKDFDKSDYVFSSNLNPVYVKLTQTCALNFTNHKAKFDSIIRKIINQKIYSLYTIYLYSNKNYEFAFEFLKDYYTRPYEDRKIKMLLIMFLLKKGQYLEAYELFLQVQQQFKSISDPMKYALIHQQACFSHKLGNYEEALQLTENLLKLYDTHPNTRKSKLKKEQIYMTLGMCYYRYGQQQRYLDQRAQYFTKAIEFLDISSTTNSFNYLTIYYLAKIHAQLYCTAKAQKYVSKCLEINPNHLASFVLLVLLLTTSGNWKKSNIILEGLRNDKMHQTQSIVNVLLGYIKVKLSQDRRQKSKRDLNFADQLWKLLKQALSPIFPNIQQKYKELQQLPQLQELIQKKSISSSSILDYQKIVLAFVDIFIQAEQYSKANQLLQKLSPNCLFDEEKQFYLGQIQLYQEDSSKNKNNRQKAIEIFQNNLNTNGQHFKTIKQLGRLYLECDSEKNMIERCEQSQAMLLLANSQQTDAEILLLIGETQEKLGQMSKSCEYLGKALELSQKVPLIPYETISAFVEEEKYKFQDIMNTK